MRHFYQDWNWKVCQLKWAISFIKEVRSLLEASFTLILIHCLHCPHVYWLKTHHPGLPGLSDLLYPVSQNSGIPPPGPSVLHQARTLVITVAASRVNSYTVTNMSNCRYWVSITIHNVLKGHPFLIQVKLFETLRCCQDCLLMTRCWHSESVTSSRLTHVWITECMTGTGAAPPLSLALEIKWPDMSYFLIIIDHLYIIFISFCCKYIPPPPANCLHLSPITCESGLIKISSETVTWRNKNI